MINLEDLDSFDLILTMDDENMERVIDLAKDSDANTSEKIRPIMSYARNTKLQKCS